MHLAFHAIQRVEIDRNAPAQQPLDTDRPAIQKSIASLRPPEVKINRLYLSAHNIFILNHMLTFGYRSKSKNKLLSVGRGVSSSNPVHISKSKWPKQITSLYSTSAMSFAETMAFTCESRPSKPFSNPDSLRYFL